MHMGLLLVQKGSPTKSRYYYMVADKGAQLECC